MWRNSSRGTVFRYVGNIYFISFLRIFRDTSVSSALSFFSLSERGYLSVVLCSVSSDSPSQSSPISTTQFLIMSGEDEIKGLTLSSLLVAD
jgi:hypothetical protein